MRFTRFPRKSRGNRVTIKVHPDCSIQVSAPEAAEDQAVIAAVQKRGRWVYRQLKGFREQLAHVTPRQYVSGEGHHYLGKQYQLKVVVSTETAEQVKLKRGHIEVSAKVRSPDRVKALLNEWYKQRAKEVFARRLGALIDQALWVQDEPQVRVLSMKTQWGSCSPNGRLTLNPFLVKAPRDCIDYVILHELCHIAEHNHSDRFYRLMSQVMPNWEPIKARLDGMANQILNGV